MKKIKTLLEISYRNITKEEYHLNWNNQWFKDTINKYYKIKKERLENIDINYQITLINILRNYKKTNKYFCWLYAYAIKHGYIIIITYINEREPLNNRYGSIFLNACAYLNACNMFTQYMNIHKKSVEKRINNLILNPYMIVNNGFANIFQIMVENSNNFDIDEITQLYFQRYYEIQLIEDLEIALIWCIKGKSKDIFLILCNLLFQANEKKNVFNFIIYNLVICNSYSLIEQFLKIYPLTKNILLDITMELNYWNIHSFINNIDN